MLTSLSLKDSGHYFSQITYWPHWRLRDNHTHLTLDLDPEEQKSISHSTQMPYTWQGTIGKNGLRTWSIHPLPSQSTPYIELRSVVFSLNVSTQHSGRCLKDTISCPWNNLHWVVGRAESYWLRLTLVSAHSKTENRLTGAP